MLLRSFILAGAFLGIFLIMLLRARKKTPGDPLLMGWLAVVSLQLLFYFDNLSPHPLAPTWLSLIGFSLPMIGSPLLYLCIADSLVDVKKLWPHALPYLIYCFVICWLPVSVSDGFPHFGRQVPDWTVGVLMGLMAIIPAGYALLTLILLWKVKRTLALSFALLFVVQFLLIRFGVSFGGLTYQNLFALVGAVLVAYVFFVGQYTLRAGDGPSEREMEGAPAADTKPRYQNSGLDATGAEQLFARLTLFMKEQEPFLDETLTLNALAGQMSVTPNQLSQAINQHASTNFFSYINAYRLEAVKQKLLDPVCAHYSIMAIAFECGFRSKSSFNKLFKEIEGKTPSEYQRTGPSLPVRTMDSAH